jgi:hypothetical protein
VVSVCLIPSFGLVCNAALGDRIDHTIWRRD